MAKVKRFPTRDELSVLCKNAFFAAYCRWFHAQNPNAAEVFTNEEIVNYMAQNIRIPWALRTELNQNPVLFFKEAYMTVLKIMPNAELYSAETHIVPVNEDVDYTFVNERIKYPSEKQVQFLRSMNERSGNPISEEEILCMDSKLCSLSLELLKAAQIRRQA